MRALWLENQKLSFRTDVPKPEAPTIRMLLAGICNTDIELTRGYYPFRGIPGHEFVGELNGKRVVGEINAVCHACEACRSGRATHCQNRTVLGIKDRNGAFADYLTLPVENLHVIPDSIETEEAVFVEPLAAALEVQEQIRISSDDRVLVVGHGKLGRLIARTLALTGCNLTVASRGAAIPEKHFDVVIECSGNPAGFEIARRAVRPRGTIVMKSTYAGELTMNASSLVVDEITIVGSRCGPFDKAIELLAAKKVNVRDLIEATYPLDDALTAFGHAQRKGALKVLIQCRP
ncbi:MAG TPA: alcohol dehydrogenase catalytic domain-containing protein [Thermoanaerobaculia bacterium]|nr:alcohol dehydrogenase catalytic domain-containing protein [Thermoanaerobaculia bacterium]